MQPLAQTDGMRLMFEAAIRSRDDLFLAASNQYERFDGFARMCLFRAEKSPSWRYFDLPVTISDATLFVSEADPAAGTASTGYFFLIEDGDVFHPPIG
ncbi:hypothetical protein [Agrobacterium sp. NPDC089420]|uniref:hypothetical protein n=1 Tax=Agrobacterium sp. NPDC089420 TaxID=3363918 RepID=UPI00384E19BE